MLITPTRRTLITGLVSLVAAPAIVRISSLMPVKAYPVDVVRRTYRPRFFLPLYFEDFEEVCWDAIADVPARKTPYESL